jgi:hypothetical protein
MQSYPFLQDTDSDDENSDYSSDSSGDLPKNNNIGVTYDFSQGQGERFLDQSSQGHYLKLRNELFTKNLLHTRICFYTGTGGAYGRTIDLVDTYKLAGLDNVIGFELIKASVTSADASVPFIDIRIPELPHICCKVNDRGDFIIDRVPLDLSTATHYKHTQERPYHNYFTPIKLSTLTLDVMLPDGVLTTGYSGFYEFEVTILNQPLSSR